MDAILTAIAGLFSKPEYVGLAVTTTGCIGLGYLHVVWRREEREDRKTLLEVINKNSEALNGLRNVLSAATGKAL